MFGIICFCVIGIIVFLFMLTKYDMDKFHAWRNRK